MKQLVVLFVLLATGPLASAQILISNFSNLAAQTYTPYNLSWHGSTAPLPAVDQYVQNSGNVSITSVNGGNPTGQGSFDGVFQGSNLNTPSPLSFAGITNIQLTARADSGNTDSSLTLVISDSNDVEIGQATFSTSSLTSSFSTLTASFQFSAGGGSPANATFWQLGGDNSVSSNVRISVDNLAAVPATAPEPTTYVLTFGGLVALIFLQRLRRKAVI